MLKSLSSQRGVSEGVETNITEHFVHVGPRLVQSNTYKKIGYIKQLNILQRTEHMMQLKPIKRYFFTRVCDTVTFSSAGALTAGLLHSNASGGKTSSW